MQISYFQMDYTDATETDHPASVWYPITISINALGSTVGIDWGAYVAAVEAAPSPAAAATNGSVVASLAMGWGQSVLDTPSPTDAVNAGGNPVMQSFFAGATVETVDTASLAVAS